MLSIESMLENEEKWPGISVILDYQDQSSYKNWNLLLIHDIPWLDHYALVECYPMVLYPKLGSKQYVLNKQKKKKLWSEKSFTAHKRVYVDGKKELTEPGWGFAVKLVLTKQP